MGLKYVDEGQMLEPRTKTLCEEGHLEMSCDL